MSRTEQDLKDALAMLEPGVGARDQIEAFARQVASQRSRPIRPFGRLRRLAPVAALPAAALLTAAVVLVAAALAPDGRDGDVQAGAAGGPRPDPSGMSWRWLFTVDAPPAGWEVGTEFIYADHQEIVMVGPGPDGPDAAFCTIQVFAAGAFDTSRVGADAVPVAVDGTEGAFSSVDLINRAFPTVSWQYAPGAYALSICDQGSVDVLDDELAAASALSAQQRPFVVPFAVGYLPAGVVLDQAHAGLVQDGGEVRGRGYVAGWGPTGGATIDLMTWPLDPRNLDGAQMLTVNTLDGPRQAAYREDRGLIVIYDDFQIWIGFGTSPSLSRDEMIRIAQNIAVAPDPLDPSTWFDAQDALP